MKYLKYFTNESDYQTFKESEDYVLPNVSFVVETNSIGYTPKKHVVFIQHIDGNLYTPAQWTGNSFSNDLANGVAVVTDEVSFIIAKDLYSNVKWYPSSTVSGATITKTESQALLDVDGYGNTEKIAPKDTSNGMVSRCANYTFPNGAKGYLPALGELKVMCDHIDDVCSAMDIIDGSPFTATYMFSSTQYDAYNVWQIWYRDGSVTSAGKTNVNYVSFRPFTKINL